MGYRLRRWFEDRLPQEISSGERVVALAIADLVWDDSRIGYGNKFMAKLLWKTGFESEAQITKVLSKLAGRGIELRVPISGADGKPLTNKRGQFVYAHRGHQRTFRVPLESEFPFRSAPYWDEEEERSADVDPRAWYDGERPPAREVNTQKGSPRGDPMQGKGSPLGEAMRQKGSPLGSQRVPARGPLSPNHNYLPPSHRCTRQHHASRAGRSRARRGTRSRCRLPHEPPRAVGRRPRHREGHRPSAARSHHRAGLAPRRDPRHEAHREPAGDQQPPVRAPHPHRRSPQGAPRRPAKTSTLPRWCGQCGDGNPAAEFNAKFRTAPGSSKPCPDCHPDTHAADAA